MRQVVRGALGCRWGTRIPKCPLHFGLLLGICVFASCIDVGLNQTLLLTLRPLGLLVKLLGLFDPFRVDWRQTLAYLISCIFTSFAMVPSLSFSVTFTTMGSYRMRLSSYSGLTKTSSVSTSSSGSTYVSTVQTFLSRFIRILCPDAL